MLDERLSTVFSLYPKCELAADIGTDHGLLPCALLESGKCKRMFLTDISPKALQHAIDETSRRHLSDRVSLLCGSGLEPLNEKCEAISITGMGGRTVSQILTEGADRLYGATLLLSAHTDLPTVRETLVSLRYHPVAEEICQAAGRFYLVIKALPGEWSPAARDLRLGSLLFQSQSPVLHDYLIHREKVLNDKLTGLLSASSTVVNNQVEELRSDIDFLREHL